MDQLYECQIIQISEKGILFEVKRDITYVYNIKLLNLNLPKTKLQNTRGNN